MIVTRKKDIDSIREHLADARSVVIVGCSECAAVCRTGGSEQVKEMSGLLADRTVCATISIESPCDKRITSRDLKRLARELEEADAIVALTCGSGAQAIAEVSGKRVIAALDTSFLGMVERLGRFYERCSQCGECILNDTAGICPVTLCPKQVRNGPCDGVRADGTCEVFEDRPCVWRTIHERLSARNHPERFTAYHPPVCWSHHHVPREELQGH